LHSVFARRPELRHVAELHGGLFELGKGLGVYLLLRILVLEILNSLHLSWLLIRHLHLLGLLRHLENRLGPLFYLADLMLSRQALQNGHLDGLHLLNTLFKR